MALREGQTKVTEQGGPSHTLTAASQINLFIITFQNKTKNL